jgi:hypothetical protein
VTDEGVNEDRTGGEGPTLEEGDSRSNVHGPNDPSTAKRGGDVKRRH